MLRKRAQYARNAANASFRWSVEDNQDSVGDLEAAAEGATVDDSKLNNLLQRRLVSRVLEDEPLCWLHVYYVYTPWIYGDIIQTSNEDELRCLLRRYNNRVPDVIKYLEQRCKRKGWRR